MSGTPSVQVFDQFQARLRLSQTDFEKERNQAWGIEERDAVGAASELQVVSGPDPDSQVDIFSKAVAPR